MAVPTSNELYAFLAEFTAKTPENLWSLGTLVDAARRNFSSTTPAIEKRIKTLIGVGKSLRPVRVDHSGLVFWGKDEIDAVEAPMCYLDLHRSGTWTRIEHGPLVLDDERTRRDNLWTNGVRIFYMLDTDHDKIVNRLTMLCEEKKAERKAARLQEKQQIRAALEEVAPQGDGPELLNKLAKLFGRGSRVNARMYEPLHYPDEPSELHITLSLDQTRVAAFLEILRNGLPKEPMK